VRVGDQASYGFLRRAIGWACFLAPIPFVFMVWVPYLADRRGVLFGVLVSCQTVSGPLAWVLLEVQPSPPAGWIFAALALALVGAYSWVIWTTPFGRRWFLLHPLVSLTWCLIGMLRILPGAA
jgi:hypothetical protein